MKATVMRGFGLLLACLIFAGMPPVAAMAAADSFTVSMHPSEKKVTVGDSVEIAVVVGHTAGVNKYNSFDMTFSYDPKILELTSTTISDMSVTARNGKVRVLRYGTDLNVDTAVFTLSFKTLRNGTTAVQAVSAKVGMKETAQDADAERAKLLNNAAIAVSAKAAASGESSNPRTGDAFAVWNAIAVSSLLGLVMLMLQEKESFREKIKQSYRR